MPRSENAGTLVQRTPRTGRLASVTNKYRRPSARRPSASIGMPIPAKLAASLQRATKPRPAVIVVKPERTSAVKVERAATVKPEPVKAQVKLESAAPVAGPSSAPCTAPPRMVDLPTRLARPTNAKEVSRAAIAAVDAALADTPVGYIRDQIVDTGIGRDMMKSCASVELLTPPGTTIPKTVDVAVSDFSAEPPTHMLAVWAAGAPARVTLFPVHGLVVAAHWAHLPPLPAGAPPPTPEEQPDGSLRAHLALPVVPLCVPDVAAFALLSAFAYARDPDALLRALVPPMPASAAPAAALAAAHPAPALVTRMLAVSALWRDACALGEWDPRLWAALDAAWAILGAAIRTSTGSVQPPRRT